VLAHLEKLLTFAAAFGKTFFEATLTGRRFVRRNKGS
jgi:hypothetical protein